MTEFYHISFDTQHLKSFIHEGIRPIGKGVGGQKDGFYVFPHKKTALSHLEFVRDLGEQDLSSPYALMIGVNVGDQDLKYPQWQFDMENSLELAYLISKYAPQFIGLKDIPYSDGQNKKTVSVIQKDPNHETKFILECPIFGPIKGQVSSQCYLCGTDMTGAWQALCDTVCQKSPEFLQDYNSLLKNTSASSLKYTGQKPLDPSFISLLEITPNAIQEVEVLYTQSKPKTEQVCPFLTLHKKTKNR